MFSCCGVLSPHDWLETKWARFDCDQSTTESMRGVTVTEKQMPESCCSKDLPTPCFLPNLRSDIKKINIVYESGCTQKLLHHISSFAYLCVFNLTSILLTMFSLWVLQSILNNYQKDRRNYNGFEYSWIFPALPFMRRKTINYKNNLFNHTIKREESACLLKIENLNNPGYCLDFKNSHDSKDLSLFNSSTDLKLFDTNTSSMENIDQKEILVNNLSITNINSRDCVNELSTSSSRNEKVDKRFDNSYDTNEKPNTLEVSTNEYEKTDQIFTKLNQSGLFYFIFKKIFSVLRSNKPCKPSCKIDSSLTNCATCSPSKEETKEDSVSDPNKFLSNASSSECLNTRDNFNKLPSEENRGENVDINKCSNINWGEGVSKIITVKEESTKEISNSELIENSLLDTLLYSVRTAKLSDNLEEPNKDTFLNFTENTSQTDLNKLNIKNQNEYTSQDEIFTPKYVVQPLIDGSTEIIDSEHLKSSDETTYYTSDQHELMDTMEDPQDCHEYMDFEESDLSDHTIDLLNTAKTSSLNSDSEMESSSSSDASDNPPLMLLNKYRVRENM